MERISRMRHVGLWGVSALVLALACGTASAQTGSRHRNSAAVADAAPPLTIRQHQRQHIPLPPEMLAPSQAPLYATQEPYDGGPYGPGFFRDWNDPRVNTFWGWRLGGDNFYGDLRGDPTSRGNASLGMIDGYGGARGGYGGPHFDAVGGFHNGPGPEAQEANDYASGNVSTPRYVPGTVFEYPSVKAQVAGLNQGIVSDRGGRPSLVKVHTAAPAQFTIPQPDDEDEDHDDGGPDVDFGF